MFFPKNTLDKKGREKYRKEYQKRKKLEKIGDGMFSEKKEGGKSYPQWNVDSVDNYEKFIQSIHNKKVSLSSSLKR